MFFAIRNPAPSDSFTSKLQLFAFVGKRDILKYVRILAKVCNFKQPLPVFRSERFAD